MASHLNPEASAMLDTPWTLGELVGTLRPGYQVVGTAVSITVSQVSIDSRLTSEGSLFVAFKGERADGHDHVLEAISAGARVALVERPISGIPMLDLTADGPATLDAYAVAVRVPSTLIALQTLARAHRLAHPTLRVFGITGSVGKTTTKEAVAAVLSARYATLKSSGNMNNEIGLPLTLLSLSGRHQVAVLEMGMYALGEIAQLCDIARPEAGVVTNVGPVHLERLGTIERIAQAKSELIRALPEDGWAVLNGDDARVRAMAELSAAPAVTYGLKKENDVVAEDISSLGAKGTSFTVRVHNHLLRDHLDAPNAQLWTPMLGRHAAMPALAAVTVGLIEGLSWDEIARGLAQTGQGIRLVLKTTPSGIQILDDTYNASPASTLAALETLQVIPGRHIAVLGDMLELGSYEEKGHRKVGKACPRYADFLLTVGTRARWIAEAAGEAGMATAQIRSVQDVQAAIASLQALLRPGDVVLIKGSRGMAMERIVAAIERWE